MFKILTVIDAPVEDDAFQYSPNYDRWIAVFFTKGFNMSISKYEKLMALANDPGATIHERKTALKMAGKFKPKATVDAQSRQPFQYRHSFNSIDEMRNFYVRRATIFPFSEATRDRLIKEAEQILRQRGIIV